MTTRLLVTAFIGLLVAPSLVTAQAPSVPEGEEVMDFTTEILGSFQLVSIGPSKEYPQDAYVRIRVWDISVQPKNPLVYPAYHTFTMEASWKGNATPPGWSLQQPFPPARPVQSGDPPLEAEMIVQHLPSAEVGLVEGYLNVTMHRQDPPGRVTKIFEWAVQFIPTPVANIRLEAGAPLAAGPDQFVTIPLSITNLDFYPASYTVSVHILEAEGVTPGDISILGTGGYYLQPGEKRYITVGFQTPRELWWYRGSQLVISFSVSPTTGEGTTLSTTHVMNLEGFYISRNFLLVTTAFLVQAALAILLILWIVRWRGENIYGKPLPPWRLPREKANLERLALEDPRAHYLVRYFFMEEEYRSALLWYHGFKRVSKKQLKAEAKIVGLRERASELEAPDLAAFDRREARLKRRWEHKIEAAKERAGNQVAGLQDRLDRSFEADYKKDHAKWEARVQKLQTQANKPFAKQQKQWARERDRILAEWEKPFRKAKSKYEKQLEAAKERYAKLVRKKDKPTFKAWRETMEDWKTELSLRKQEGKEPVPEPELLSALVPREGFPEPLQLPSRPDLPPEPQRPKLTDLPPEPQLVQPRLEDSHYAAKGRRIERARDRLIKRYRGELRILLEVLAAKRRVAETAAERQREQILKMTHAAARPRWTDRVLGRTPEAQELRHRRAFIRGQARERLDEFVAVQEAGVERIRVEAERKEAELEARIIRGRAEARKAAQLGTATTGAADSADPRAAERKELRAKNRLRVREAEGTAQKAIEAKREELKGAEQAQLAQLEESRRQAAADKVSPSRA